MNEREGVWHTPYLAARALLFLRGFYLLLTADLWFAMVEHGGRYGIGGFNVAHFGWLDRLLPLPSPALYVGLLIAAGLVSLQLAIGPAPRWLRLLLAALYTFAWLLSMHDSYQHHYLISWLLIWCAGYPEVPVSDAAVRANASAVGWGFPMTAITCAIVYTFTGISKCEPVWRSGHVLRVLTHSRPPSDPDPGKFDGLRDVLLVTGLDDGQIWHALALATIALQWMIALGYLAALGRDTAGARWRHRLANCGLLGSLAFHSVAELFRVFEIGLFSYYMLWIATVALAPGAIVVAIARVLGRTFDAGRGIGRRLIARTAPGPRGSRTTALLTVPALLLLGWIIPLPGARGASAFCALISLLRYVRELRDCDPPSRALTFALRGVITLAAAGFSLGATSVPFDYYRRTAGELRRMGRLEQALDTYRAAEHHAPRGNSRAQTIRELETELARDRAERSRRP